MSTQLIIGVLLIAAGILLAVAAYWLISSNVRAKEPEFADKVREEGMPQETGIADSVTMDNEGISENLLELPIEAQTSSAQEVLGTADERAHDQPPAADPHDRTDLASHEMDKGEAVKPGKPDLQPQIGQRINIATLLRDDVTGKLIVKVGGKEYHSPEDLRISSDWTRVEYAALDLQTWISKDAPALPKVEHEPEAPAPKPTSMIEQINAILQEKIESSGRSQLAVRLMESPSGAARVLIGVQSFDLADVPDEEVRRLIQEAVAIWEADQ